MPRISTTGAAAGAAAALTLMAVGTPAFGAGHPAKKPQLAHTHLTVHAKQEKLAKNDKVKATVVARLRSHKQGLADETVELFPRDKGGPTKWTDTGSGAT